nr:MAG TPA: hypothetical protein [Caudoviricetes sp.]
MFTGNCNMPGYIELFSLTWYPSGIKILIYKGSSTSRSTLKPSIKLTHCCCISKPLVTCNIYSSNRRIS